MGTLRAVHESLPRPGCNRVCAICGLPEAVRAELEAEYNAPVKPVSARSIVVWLKRDYPEHVAKWNGSMHAQEEAVRRHFRYEHHLTRRTS